MVSSQYGADGFVSVWYDHNTDSVNFDAFDGAWHEWKYFNTLFVVCHHSKYFTD